MGEGLITFYRERVKRSWKIAFAATMLIGLLTHIYKFTNTLLNHDSMYNFYSDQNVVKSGRWFLSIACGLSSYFDLPWVNGLLSLFFIALTVVVIIAIFQIDNPIAVVLVSGVVVTFPAITSTFQYEFTADGYMVAMFLSALAVYFSTFEKVKWYHTVFSIVALCLSCGIYQAYVSFAFLMMAVYLTDQLLKGERTNKQVWGFLGKQLVIFAVAMIAYYGIWKACLLVQGVEATSYQGIDKIGEGIFSFGAIKENVLRSLKTIFDFFELNVFWHGITAYSVLNWMCFGALGLGLILAFIKRAKKKDGMLQIALSFVALALCIPAACMWYFVSQEVGYHNLMLQSLCVVYLFVILLYEKHLKIKPANVVASLMALIIFNNLLIANISYFYMQKTYETSYATATEIVHCIHDKEDELEFESIAIVGGLKIPGDDWRRRELAMVYTMSELSRNLIFDSFHTKSFLLNVLSEEYTYAEDDVVEVLEEKEEVRSMPCWPSRECMALVDNVLVIKLGEIASENTNE